MNAKSALCKALLSGRIVSIKTGFDDFGITNIPREIGRAIERPRSKGQPNDHGFGVRVSRVRRFGKSRYKVACTWMEYRLNKTTYNEAGIQKMIAYVKKNK